MHVIVCQKDIVISCTPKPSLVITSLLSLFLLLKLEISSLERSRSVMSEELVRLTNLNDEMDEKVMEIPKLKVQLKVGTVNLENSPRDKKRWILN